MLMKKIFTLFAAAVMALSASAEAPVSKTWNFGEGAFVDVTEVDNNTIDGMEFVGSMKITANNKTFEDVKYTKRLQTGGKSSATNRVMKFEVPGPCTISTICCSASSGDPDRVVSIAEGTYENVIGSGKATTENVDKVSANYTGTTPTTIFIYAGGGVNFYAVSYAGGSTAISDINVDNANAPVEYFNLQGIRVENPANGLYIRRQGNKVEKVYVK